MLSLLKYTEGSVVLTLIRLSLYAMDTIVHADLKCVHLYVDVDVEKYIESILYRVTSVNTYKTKDSHLISFSNFELSKRLHYLSWME